VIGFGGATRVYLATGATDMRKGFDGLYALSRDRIGEDPLSGHVFVFCNGPRTRVKVLYWDGSGLWVCAKRLEKGRFSWPEAEEGCERVKLAREDLVLLLGGIELDRTRRKGWYRREVA